jgi:hypothetical protein
MTFEFHIYEALRRSELPVRKIERALAFARSDSQVLTHTGGSLLNEYTGGSSLNDCWERVKQIVLRCEWMDPPPGMARVTDGNVARGDFFYIEHLGAWAPVPKSGFGAPIEHHMILARGYLDFSKVANMGNHLFFAGARHAGVSKTTAGGAFDGSSPRRSSMA